MRDFAIVKAIDGRKIEVVSLISNACVTCNSIECAKKGKSFYVLNKKDFPLEENAIVRIGFPRILRGILGLISLLLPVLSSVAGFFFSEQIAAYFSLPLTQSVQACIIGIFFTVAAFLVFVGARTDIHLTSPEILQVM